MPELGKNLIDTITAEQKGNLIVEIADTVSLELTEFNTFFTQMEDGYNYLGGEQIAPDKKEWFISQDRPAKVYNLLLPRFNSIMGDFLLNQQKRRVFALPGGDPAMATLRQKMLDQLYSDKEVKWELTATALAGLLCSGYTQVCVENERNIEGEIVIKNRNEFEIMFDSRSTHPFLDDAAYMIRFQKKDPTDIINIWKEHRTKLKELFGVRTKRDENELWMQSLGLRERGLAVNKTFFDRSEGKYTVVEYHKWVWEEIQIFTDLITGVTEPIPPGLPRERLEAFLKLHPVHKLSDRRVRLKQVTTVIPGLHFMLEHYRPALQDGTFDIQKYSFYPYGKRAIKDFGVFKSSQDILDGFNENKNNEATILKRAASPGFKYKPTSLENPEDVELYGSKPDINFMVKAGVRLDDAVKQNDPPPNPTALSNLVAEDVELMDRVMGVAANFGGQTQTKQENASLFAQRIQQTQQGFQIGYSQYARHNQRLDNKALRLQQLYYTTERTVMITTPGNAKPETFILNMGLGDQVINDFTQGRFESIVDEQNSTPTMRLVRFQLKSELIDRLSQLFGPAIVGAIPWDWYLGEAVDMGDLTPLIRGIEGLVEGQGEQGEKDQAFEEITQLFAAAKEQLEIRKLAGERVGGEQRQLAA